MSLNDPFFDAWVRDKLQHAEVRTPEHLWDVIRRKSRFYNVGERNKYLPVLFLLLFVTGSVGYWAFHPSAPRGKTIPGLMAESSPVLHSGPAVAPTIMTPEHRGILPARRRDPARSAAIARASPTAEPTATPTVASTVAPTTVRPAESTTPSTVASTVAPTAVRTAEPTAPPTVAPTAVRTAEPTATSTAVPTAALTTDPTGAPASEVAAAATTREALASAVSKGNDLTVPIRTGELPLLRTVELLPASSFTPAPTSGAAPVIAGPQRKHTYLEIYAGPDHITHYIKASGPAYAAYVRQAMNIEVGYPSFSIGLRLDMPVIGDNWRLQGGIHYAQINEQLHYFNPSVDKTVSQVTTRSVVQPSGNTVLVTDTSQVTYKGQYLKQSLNAYRMIDIPVLVSYTFYRNTQFELGGSAGAFFNIISRYHGDILDTNFQPTALHAGNGDGVSTWKSSIGTSLYGSLSLHDQLTRHVQVGLEPYLRYELGAVNRDVSVYRERFVTTGLALSIRYALGR